MIISLDRNIRFGNEKRNHLLRPGLALKLPTGKTNSVGLEGKLLDPDLQAGSGSYDVILRLNYLNTSIDKGIGYSLAVNYKINSKGAQQYKFGDSWNAQIQMIYVLTGEERMVNLIPRIGLFAEGSKMNQKNSQDISFTGGETLFSSFGVDFQTQNWSFQTQLQLPIIENRNSTQIGNAGRLNLSLTRSF